MKMRRSKILGMVAVGALVAGIGTGGAVAALNEADGPRSPIPPEAAAPTIGVTLPEGGKQGTMPDGRSFGPAPVLGDGAQGAGGQVDPKQFKALLPDMVLVVGDNGHEGYADADAVLGDDDVRSPAEALQRQAEAAKNGPTRLPVYDTDGKQIDTFTLQ